MILLLRLLVYKATYLSTPVKIRVEGHFLLIIVVKAACFDWPIAVFRLLMKHEGLPIFVERVWVAHTWICIGIRSLFCFFLLNSARRWYLNQIWVYLKNGGSLSFDAHFCLCLLLSCRVSGFFLRNVFKRSLNCHFIWCNEYFRLCHDKWTIVWSLSLLTFFRFSFILLLCCMCVTFQIKSKQKICCLSQSSSPTISVFFYLF